MSILRKLARLLGTEREHLMRPKLPCPGGPVTDGKGLDRQVLGDVLMEGLHIWATCRNCRHRASLSPLGLAKRLGYDQSLAALRRKLRCSKCGERVVHVRTIEPERR
jgi:hypothetical protein